jgi:Tol biopolymer transport system component
MVTENERKQSPARGAWRARLDRADVAVGIAVIVLLVAIGVTVAAGDQAGIGVADYAPRSDVHTRSTLRITFTEAMDTASAEAAFDIQPPLAGAVSWVGNQLRFTPTVAWEPGTSYTITVRAGAVSASGRALLQPVRWTMNAARPRIVFLAPALQETNLPPNLWIVDAEPTAETGKPAPPRQLTNEPLGVENFAPSPDGTEIVYAAATPENTLDLFLLTVATGEKRRLTRCVDAICQSPNWHPDGQRLAYERIERNTALPAADQGASRVWLLTLSDLSTVPLFRESQLLGAYPRWSPDGSALVFYDRNLGATVIFNLISGERQEVENYGGDTGEYRFDRTGQRLVYPRLVSIGRLFSTELWLADFTARTTQTLSGPDSPPVEDFSPSWNPADGSLVVSRRYLDSSGIEARQVYRLDPAAKTSAPLFTDPRYHHTALHWSPDGGRLVMMRRALNEESPPDLWIYDAKTATIWKVATDAYLPQWLP